MKKSNIPRTAETFFPRLCGMLFFLLLASDSWLLTPAFGQSISVTTPIRTLPTTLTTPQFQIQPAPTQTADEMQWKNAAGAVVTYVDKDGVLHFPGGGGGISNINGLTASTQYFVVCNLGLDFNIQDSIDTHSLCIPDASATARGLVTTGAQVIGGPKTFPDSTLIDDDLYVTGNFSTDHPIEITGEACGTAEANVGLFGFDPVTGEPCFSYDGSTPGPFPFPRLNEIRDPSADWSPDLGGHIVAFQGAMGAPGIVINTTGNFAGIGVGRAPDGRYDFDAFYEGVINASAGYTQNDGATNGNCLVGNGFYFVDAPCTATGVTDVTASSPLSSTGGATPDLSCPTCVTDVTASGPLSSTGGTTPNISCPTCVTGFPRLDQIGNPAANTPLTMGGFTFALTGGIYEFNDNHNSIYFGTSGSPAGNYPTSTGLNNVGIGSDAFVNNTTGSENVAIGHLSLFSNTTGTQNTGVGFSALKFTTGDSNTALGAGALNANTSGSQNTSVGAASSSSTTGGGNTTVGYGALGVNTTGTNNTAIGAAADVGSSGLTNATAIGSNAVVAASNSMQLGSTAVTLVNTSATVAAKRFKASNGTALVSGDFTPTGWGAGAAVGTVSGTDQWFQFTVTAGTVPSLSPTVALTYKDGTWTTAPIPICNINGGTGAISFTPATSTATVLTLTYVGTPVNALTYIIACHVGGI